MSKFFKCLIFVNCFIFCMLFVYSETFALTVESMKKDLAIVRDYSLVAVKGKPFTVELPALMSFWGATNSQIIKSSKFEYSEEPDTVEITADNRGMERRYYKLSWNSPKSTSIKVKQILSVELSLSTKLYTAATLPYNEDILTRFSSSLAANKDESINTEDPRIVAVSKEIIKKTNNIEEIVEEVCDWVNANISFLSGQKDVEKAFKTGKGNCTSMSKIACAILRKTGIPTEIVSAKFIGSDRGHEFIEVYFPDAGWVFYDPSNSSRGFLFLSCLLTAGWAYKSCPGGNCKWVDGYFCKEEVLDGDDEISFDQRKPLRKNPANQAVIGVKIIKENIPSDVKIRKLPISQLIMNLEIKPGVRDYE